MKIVKMKKFLYLLMLLVSSSKAAQEHWDLKCTLDTGEIMTLSHSKTTVYIAFKSQDNSSDEGDRMIRLNINSGEVQQHITENNITDTRFFVLRGTGEDIEGAIAIDYEEYKGQPDIGIRIMNYMGKDFERHSCLIKTIDIGNNLLYRGIENAPSIN